MGSFEQPGNDAGHSGSSRKPPIRVGAAIVVALLAGFAAWIVIDRSGDNSATTTVPPMPSVTAAAGPVAVSQKALSRLAASVGHTVYWAGDVGGQRPEFTRTSADRVYVRYLPKGVEAGDKRSNFLIIATYPFPDAYAKLKRQAEDRAVEIPGGGIALVNAGYPQSVHFAFPGIAYQGEVYDPSPKKALAVATSGDLQPVP